MIIVAAVDLVAIRKTVGENVMGSLDMERLLDLGIRCDQEVQQDQTRQYKHKSDPCCEQN